MVALVPVVHRDSDRCSAVVELVVVVNLHIHMKKAMVM